VSSPLWAFMGYPPTHNLFPLTFSGLPNQQPPINAQYASLLAQALSAQGLDASNSATSDKAPSSKVGLDALAKASAQHVSGLDVLADQAVQQSSKSNVQGGSGEANKSLPGKTAETEGQVQAAAGGVNSAEGGAGKAGGSAGKKRDLATALGGGGDVQALHALRALQMQGMMAAGNQATLLSWCGNAAVVPWLLHEPEGQIYQYGADMHGIEQVLKHKLRKFHAEEPHDEWAERFFKEHGLHTRPYVAKHQSKVAGPVVVVAKDAPVPHDVAGGSTGEVVVGGKQATPSAGKGKDGGESAPEEANAKKGGKQPKEQATAGGANEAVVVSVGSEGGEKGVKSGGAGAKKNVSAGGEKAAGSDVAASPAAAAAAVNNTTSPRVKSAPKVVPDDAVGRRVTRGGGGGSGGGDKPSASKVASPSPKAAKVGAAGVGGGETKKGTGSKEAGTVESAQKKRKK
jgi:hypothetical protein